MKIGVIHANASAVAPLEAAFQAAAPSAEVCNFINGEMLKIVDACGVTPEALKLFVRTVFEADEQGVDGILIACSVFCGYAEAVQPFLNAPILAVDAPALEEIVARGGKVGILATTAASAPACQAKLDKLCAKKGAVLQYEYGICTEALDALRQGQGDVHDRLLAEEGRRLADLGCTTLFLSQITMARARQAFGPLQGITITTPDAGVRKMLRLVREKQSYIMS